MQWLIPFSAAVVLLFLEPLGIGAGNSASTRRGHSQRRLSKKKPEGGTPKTQPRNDPPTVKPPSPDFIPGGLFQLGGSTTSSSATTNRRSRRAAKKARDSPPPIVVKMLRDGRSKRIDRRLRKPSSVAQNEDLQDERSARERQHEEFQADQRKRRSLSRQMKHDGGRPRTQHKRRRQHGLSDYEPMTRRSTRRVVPRNKTESNREPRESQIGDSKHLDELYDRLYYHNELPPFRSWPEGLPWPSRLSDYHKFMPFYHHREDVQQYMKVFFVDYANIKLVIKTVRMVDGNRCPQLLNEIEGLSLLGWTENVIQFYHAFIDNDILGADYRPHSTVAMVVEYLNGGDLYNQDEFDEATARPIVYDILEGLSELHDRGFMHCDMKLENVMLHRKHENDRYIAKIIDLGLMRRFAPDGSLQRGHHIGTWGYYSPEYFRDGLVNRSSDFWALGVMVHKMVVGVYPSGNNQRELRRYRNSTDPEIRKKYDELVAEEIAIFSQLRWLESKSLTPQCKAFIRGLLKIDPMRRLGFASDARKHPWMSNRVFDAEYKALKQQERERNEHEKERESNDEDY